MSSGSEPLGGVARLYSESLAEHGPSSRAVGWKDESSQRLRFEKLLEIVEPGDHPLSVADLGCGYGAMFGFLAERLGDRVERYVGYEISPEMLDSARERVTDERARFMSAARPSEPVDYSFASGPFNVKLEASDGEWEAEIRDALRALATTSTRGLAFNLLTTRVDWREPHLFYADPARFVDFARRELGPSVELLEDYGLYEWTMLVRFER
jgi:SAM-dependent methyltransferase